MGSAHAHANSAPHRHGAFSAGLPVTASGTAIGMQREQGRTPVPRRAVSHQHVQHHLQARSTAPAPSRPPASLTRTFLSTSSFRSRMLSLRPAAISLRQPQAYLTDHSDTVLLARRAVWECTGWTAIEHASFTHCKQGQRARTQSRLATSHGLCHLMRALYIAFAQQPTECGPSACTQAWWLQVLPANPRMPCNRRSTSFQETRLRVRPG